MVMATTVNSGSNTSTQDIDITTEETGKQQYATNMQIYIYIYIWGGGGASLPITHLKTKENQCNGIIWQRFSELINQMEHNIRSHEATGGTQEKNN